MQTIAAAAIREFIDELRNPDVRLILALGSRERHYDYRAKNILADALEKSLL